MLYVKKQMLFKTKANAFSSCAYIIYRIKGATTKQRVAVLF